MRRADRVLAALLLALGLAVVPAAAQAGEDRGGTTGPCVSRAEYRAVAYGWSKARVHNLFDTAGWRSNIETSRVGTQEHRKYNACDGGLAYIVQFTDWNRSAAGFEVTRKFR